MTQPPPPQPGTPHPHEPRFGTPVRVLFNALYLATEAGPGRAVVVLPGTDPRQADLPARYVVPPTAVTSFGHGVLPESCLEVLRDLAAGLTSRQIASRRHLSPRAVALRISRANQHLGTTTAAQAVYEATVRGLLPLRPARETASA